MKKIIKIALCAALLALTVGCAVSCGAKDLLSQKEKEGYDVTVKYDPNGGMFAETADTVIYDAFDIDSAKTDSKGNKVIKLVAPEDETIRGKENAKSITHKGNAYAGGTVKYTFAGWYRVRELRVDENGNALDDYGRLASETGRPQGYVYSGRWDFDNDRLSLDPNADYNISESVLTLYAAWVPYTTFEIYDEEGQLYGDPIYSTSFEIPTWNKVTGEVSYGALSKRAGKTFDSAYLLEDTEMKNPLSGKISGKINYENATLESETVKIITTWLDGEWYKIFNANQFRNKFKSEGNYILGADIDFSGYDNPLGHVAAFSGSIDGNGFVIKGLSAKLETSNDSYYGALPTLTKDAKLINLTFTDVKCTLSGALRGAKRSFGLLFKGVEDGAVIENLSVSGDLLVGFTDASQIQMNADLNILSADGWLPDDMTNINITCTLSDALAQQYEAVIYSSGEIFLKGKE